MNAQVEPVAAGIHYDLPNEEYHSGPGISKSGLDSIARNPASFIWQQNAPVNEDKLQALDMGTAIHCLLLEPDEFEDRFIIAPEFNRRTKQGKEDEAAFLKQCADSGKIIMTKEEGDALRLMAGSVNAHPTASALLSAEGVSEVSIYWTDDETGELCRIRPDRMIPEHHIIIDVKKVADIDRFERHAEEFRYHVQDAMYSEGYYRHFGVWPKFYFLLVSSSISAGRYPVDVVELDPDWKQAGAELFREDLQTYHRCKEADSWIHIRKANRPRWAA